LIACCCNKGASIAYSAGKYIGVKQIVHSGEESNSEYLNLFIISYLCFFGKKHLGTKNLGFQIH